MTRYLFAFLMVFAVLQTQAQCLKKFNNTLEKPYSNILDELTDQFEKIVSLSQGDSFSNKCRNFLKPLSEGNEAPYKDIKPKEIQLENLIQLDTLIHTYDKIVFENGEQKMMSQFKPTSKYSEALGKVENCNQLIVEYNNMISSLGPISPVLIANGAINNWSNTDFNNPIVKRILAVEILLPLYLSHN